MRPTRLSQPYRAGGGRAPSPVLDAMKAGRSSPSPGAALMGAMRRQGGGQKRQGVMIPRAASPFRRNMRA